MTAPAAIGPRSAAQPAIARKRTPKSALLLSAFLLSMVPWPIYVDLATRSWIWRSPADSFDALEAGAVPIPIGAFAFVAFCAVNTLRIRGVSIRTQPFTLSPLIAWAITSVLVLLFALNAFSSGSLAKFIQLYIILLALFGLRLPVIPADIRFLSKTVFLSFFVFLALHMWGVFTSEQLTEEPIFAYATFLNGSVHGSLVSYPPIVFLYGVVLLIKSVNAKRQAMPLMLGTVAVLFALYADRRETMVQVLILGTMLALFVVLLLLSPGKDRLLVRCVVVLAIVIPAIVYLLQISHVTSFERLFTAEQTDPRLEIWATAAPNDLGRLFFGNMQASNTAHSLILSLLVSFGLLGLVPLVLISVGVVKFVRMKTREMLAAGRVDRSTAAAVRQFTLWAFTVNLITSNIFNTNITQLYYVVNVIMLFMLMRASPTSVLRGGRPVARAGV